MRAFVFPGQGSQAVGMGKALADAFPQARAVFDEVDDALGERAGSENGRPGQHRHAGGFGQALQRANERLWFDAPGRR